jgi:hypothetical protein
MTPRFEFRVYLSSTVADLEPERERARLVLSEFGVTQDSYRASDIGVVAPCITDVRQCDLYVAILGDRYGHVPGGEDDPDAKSITQLEYEACDAAEGRPAIRRLVFMRKNSPREFTDALVHKPTADRIEAFRKAANGPNEAAFMFDNIDQFAAELRVRVFEQADRFHKRSRRLTHRFRQRGPHAAPVGWAERPADRRAHDRT